MFSFEGDFRRTPKVSLGGASRKEEKASLLHRTQEERRKREYAIQRGYFDHCVCQCQSGSGPQLTDNAILGQLVRQLLFFYRQSEDRHRMIWMCQSLVKHHTQFVKLLTGPERQSCLFQIKRILGHCCRLLQAFEDNSLNVTVPMRMLEVFSSERTYLPFLQDENYVTALIEQILHYMVQKGYYRSLYVLVNHKLPSSLEYSDAPSIPLAQTLLEHTLKPLHFTYSSCPPDTRQFVFSAFTEEFISAPFTKQIYHFFVPALADPKLAFPFQNFLWSLQATVSSSAQARAQAPWLFYFVLSVGESGLGSLSEEGLLLYLNALQTLLPLLPVTECNRRADINSDSEDEEEMTVQHPAAQDGSWISVHYITEECVQKLDTKQQTNALLTLVWRDSASEDIFTMMASICHTLMVMSRGSPMSPEDSNRIIPLFYLFSSLFSHSLISVHDSEFFGSSADGQSQSSMMPFSLAELVTLSRCLRDACLGIIKLAYPETKTEHKEEYVAAFRSVGVKTNSQVQQRIQAQQKRWVQLFKVITNLVKMLKARDIRRPFCPSGHWLSNEVNIRADKVTQLYVPSARHVWRTRRMGRIGPLQSTLDVGLEPPPLSVSEERHLAILTELPFVVPFEERVKIFQKLIYADKREVQGEGPFLDGVNITIRRNYIYEDAYDKLSPENEPDLKKRIRVHLLNAHGLDEAGIDGGGIFREFLNELLKSGFNPNQGFFKTTNEGLLYPSPTAEMLVGEFFTRHYYFLGRILGKALYENMLVELPFASFFLSKILGTSAEVDIHHLASLDPEMYRNLLFLKSYEGDVEDLGLNFTVVNNDLGEAQVVELKPGGKDIPVTTANRIAYIHLVADYRLNKQIRAHCLAFRQGLANVVNLEWLRMFDQQEIQVLISGAHVPICLEDLKKFTNYSGGYSANHPVINIFWDVVESFSDEEKRKLLKFVTSCSRPPLLGFKELYPAFCIHNGGADLERLPTASTCMNLLKLPEFCDSQQMRNKLLYAIESSAGFELS
ncbi:Ubiquitin-protein ligase E3C [Anabarilius grahami]|uniref:Ubiquitin-protein ligase E3C n=1 Tax=Anabarilius grahami TaxID=495550 RepID=A0A3N0XXZ0_ANAGA|nr:Ubiquitin-protein ligase E3C [Anabarilius grahami]